MFSSRFMLFPTFRKNWCKTKYWTNCRVDFFRETFLSYFISVDHVYRDSGNLYPIYIYKQNCGVGFWTCWWEISGNRVALLFSEILFSKYSILDLDLICWILLRKCIYCLYIVLRLITWYFVIPIVIQQEIIINQLVFWMTIYAVTRVNLEQYNRKWSNIHKIMYVTILL